MAVSVSKHSHGGIPYSQNYILVLPARGGTESYNAHYSQDCCSANCNDRCGQRRDNHHDVHEQQPWNHDQQHGYCGEPFHVSPHSEW